MLVSEDPGASKGWKHRHVCYTIHDGPSLDQGGWKQVSCDDVIAATTPDAVVKQMLAGFAATVMVGGHTHIQMIRRYEDVYLVNVGSVGLPGVNAGSAELASNRHVHWAEYGVLSIESARLSIDLRRTPLDMSAVLKAGASSGMPHVEWWMQKWENN